MPDLQLPIYIKTVSPGRETTQIFENIIVGQPDPSLFKVPADYALKEQTPAESGQKYEVPK